MDLFKKIKKDKNLPIVFNINRVIMPHPPAEGEQKELKCWMKLLIKRGQVLKWLSPFEAKPAGAGFWEIEVPPSEQFKKFCRFSFDSKKGAYSKKLASIEVHYSCFSMKDKFQKIHAFDIDMAQYLNDKNVGAEKIIHSQDDVVLKCESGPAQGLKIMMELEIGS